MGKFEDVQAVETISSIYRMIDHNHDLAMTLDFIAEQVARHLRHKYCAISLFDPDRRRFEIRGSHGLSMEYVLEVNKMLNDCIEQDGIFSRKSVTLRSFASGEIIKIESRQDSWEYDMWNSLAQKTAYDSAIFVPLKFAQESIGVLACYDDQRTYEEGPVRTLGVVADQVATAVALARTLHKQEEIISALEEQKARARKLDDDRKRVALYAEEMAPLTFQSQTLDHLLARVTDVIGKRVVFHTDDQSLEAQTWPTKQVRGRRTYGFVSFPPGPLPDSSDADLLREVARLCALHFHRTEAALDEETRKRGMALAALVSEEASSADRTEVLVNALQLSSREKYRLGLVRQALHPDPSELVRALFFRTDCPNAAMGGDLVVLAPQQVFRDSAVTDRFRSHVEDGVLVGPLCVSEPVDQPSALRHLFRRTAAVARLLSETRRESVCFMDEWPIHRLAVDSAADPGLRERCAAIASDLPATDKSDLRRTATTFFDHDLSKVETARALHIHVNTLTQRLHQIESRTQLRLRNIDDLMQLRLALLVSDVEQFSRQSGVSFSA